MTANRLSRGQRDMLAYLAEHDEAQAGRDGWPMGTAKALERRGLIRLRLRTESTRRLFGTTSTYYTVGTATITPAGREALS